MAVLTAVVVLPSLGFELVKCRMRGAPSAVENNSDVRSERTASATALFGSLKTISGISASARAHAPVPTRAGSG